MIYTAVWFRADPAMWWRTKSMHAEICLVISHLTLIIMQLLCIDHECLISDERFSLSLSLGLSGCCFECWRMVDVKHFLLSTAPSSSSYKSFDSFVIFRLCWSFSWNKMWFVFSSIFLGLFVFSFHFCFLLWCFHYFTKSTQNHLVHLQQMWFCSHLLSTMSYLDETRVGIWGWGYGGYVTAMVLGTQQEVYKCGISVSPIADYLFYSK